MIDSGLACYALTNIEAETYPVRRDRYDFLSWFEGTVVSGFEGIAKPDRQIYELLLRRFSLDPAATLFADDSQVNVASAAQAGMDADQTKLGTVTFGHVCPLSALERMVTDGPPASTADLQALGLAIDRV